MKNLSTKNENSEQVPYIPTRLNLTAAQWEEIKPYLLDKVAPAVAMVRSKYQIFGRALNLGDCFAIAEVEGIALADGPEFEKFSWFKDFAKGALMNMPDGKRVLWLADFWKPTQDLQVFLHELGHYFLMHPGGTLTKWEADKTGFQVLECEADLFAELLSA